MTIFTTDTNQSWTHPEVRVGDGVVPLNRFSQILSVTWATQLTFDPHVRDSIVQALWALNVMKALSGWSWDFSTDTFMGTYKAIAHPILDYTAPIWVLPLRAHLELCFQQFYASCSSNLQRQ